MITPNEATTKKYLDSFMKTIQNAASSEDDVVRAVLCLGEIGARKDLSGVPNIIQFMSGLFKH